MDPALTIFDGLAGVVTGVPVRLVGAWSESREPRTADVVYSTYKGTFESDVPLVGIIATCSPTVLHWAKSAPRPTATGTPIELWASGWRSDAHRAGIAVRLQGAERQAILEDVDAPPWDVGTSNLVTGIPHRIWQWPGLACVVVLFARADVKMGRNRIWHLRPELVSKLADPRDWMTGGRSGAVKMR